jgi:hypothetical protein
MGLIHPEHPERLRAVPGHQVGHVKGLLERGIAAAESDALPPLPTLPANLRALAANYRALENRSAQPEDSFIRLSHILDRFPEVSLQDLAWSVSGSEDGSEPRTGAGAPVKTDLYLVTTLRATLPAGTGLRQQMAISDAFQAALAADPALQVVFLKRPLNMEPGTFLRSDSDLGNETILPDFSLRFSRRL